MARPTNGIDQAIDALIQAGFSYEDLFEDSHSGALNPDIPEELMWFLAVRHIAYLQEDLTGTLFKNRAAYRKFMESGGGNEVFLVPGPHYGKFMDRWEAREEG